MATKKATRKSTTKELQACLDETRRIVVHYAALEEIVKKLEESDVLDFPSDYSALRVVMGMRYPHGGVNPAHDATLAMLSRQVITAIVEAPLFSEEITPKFLVLFLLYQFDDWTSHHFDIFMKAALK